MSLVTTYFWPKNKRTAPILPFYTYITRLAFHPQTARVRVAQLGLSDRLRELRPMILTAAHRD